MASIYLVRHGQASFGKPDYDALSELGRQQSVTLGQHWDAISLQPTRVITGEMKRHQQTADGVMEALEEDPERQEMAAFNEFDHLSVLAGYRPEFGDFSAIMRHFSAFEDPHKAFQQTFEQAMERWISGRFDGEYPESWEDFRQRVVGGLKTVVQQTGKDDTVVVFTSGGPVALILQHLMDLTDEAAVQLSWTLANCAMTRISLVQGQPRLLYFNNFSHFEIQPRLLSWR